MHLIPLISAILVATALFAWVNQRTFKLPTTIGVMVVALLMSLALFAFDSMGFDVRGTAQRIESTLPFREALMDGMLAFLLFAGALHVDLGLLWSQKGVVGLLATAGVLLTTVMAAALTYAVFNAMGMGIGFGPCLLFGALISPTDPIAVMAILKQAKAPETLEVKIAGESLFNDGIGVVLFTVVVGIVAGTPGVEGALGGHGGGVSFAAVGGLFAQEVLGGIGLGLAAGAIAWLLLRTIADAHVETLITLALAAGTYSLAHALHASGPLAVVVAGLAIGHTRYAWAETDQIEHQVQTFWEILDELLNAVLFMLIGLEVVVLELEPGVLLAGVAAIPAVLFARWLSVSGAVKLFARVREFTPGAAAILTWGGLRGGISIALALSIPSTVAEREALITITYVVVVFSILVQGLTIGRLVQRMTGGAQSA